MIRELSQVNLFLQPYLEVLIIVILIPNDEPFPKHRMLTHCPKLLRCAVDHVFLSLALHPALRAALLVVLKGGASTQRIKGTLQTLKGHCSPIDKLGEMVFKMLKSGGAIQHSAKLSIIREASANAGLIEGVTGARETLGVIKYEAAWGRRQHTDRKKPRLAFQNLRVLHRTSDGRPFANPGKGISLVAEPLDLEVLSELEARTVSTANTYHGQYTIGRPPGTKISTVQLMQAKTAKRSRSKIALNAQLKSQGQVILQQNQLLKAHNLLTSVSVAEGHAGLTWDGETRSNSADKASMVTTTDGKFDNTFTTLVPLKTKRDTALGILCISSNHVLSIDMPAIMQTMNRVDDARTWSELFADVCARLVTYVADGAAIVAGFFDDYLCTGLARGLVWTKRKKLVCFLPPALLASMYAAFDLDKVVGNTYLSLWNDVGGWRLVLIECILSLLPKLLVLSRHQKAIVGLAGTGVSTNVSIAGVHSVMLGETVGRRVRVAQKDAQLFRAFESGRLCRCFQTMFSARHVAVCTDWPAENTFV